MPSLQIHSIGVLRSCFKEKFGTPRQSGLIPEARAILKLNHDARFVDSLRHLEGFSHVWVVFHFHALQAPEWKPLITPPRIDGPGRVGVFASRSPHRPNNLGLSAFKLEKIDWSAKGGIEIHLSGVDVLDETPVYDLKPYVPYVDCIPNATEAWTNTEIPKFAVDFSEESLITISVIQAQKKQDFDLKLLLEQTLQYDPRPTSQRAALPILNPENEGRIFAFRILDLDIHWQIRDGKIYVQKIEQMVREE